MKNINIIFNFFIKKLFRSKKTKFFILFSLVPLVIFLIINGLKLIYNSDLLQGRTFFANGGMAFFFQLYIQLISLLFGASVLSDEIEGKTLIYLNTSPITKLSILGGKFSAYFLVSFLSFMFGSALLYIATNLNRMLTIEHLSILLRLEFAGLIAILAYSSLFLLMGVALKRSTILGVFFIFGWEGIAQFLPGTAQKFTIFFYLNSLTPIRIPRENSILNFSVSRPDFAGALITLLVFTAIFFALSVYIFKKKEYLLADHS